MRKVAIQLPKYHRVHFMWSLAGGESELDTREGILFFDTLEEAQNFWTTIEGAKEKLIGGSKNSVSSHNYVELEKAFKKGVREYNKPIALTDAQKNSLVELAYNRVVYRAGKDRKSKRYTYFSGTKTTFKALYRYGLVDGNENSVNSATLSDDGYEYVMQHLWSELKEGWRGYVGAWWRNFDLEYTRTQRLNQRAIKFIEGGFYVLEKRGWNNVPYPEIVRLETLDGNRAQVKESNSYGEHWAHLGDLTDRMVIDGETYIFYNEETEGGVELTVQDDYSEYAIRYKAGSHASTFHGTENIAILRTILNIK